ncbi:MAG: hypothetical protein U9Q71_05100 [Pseudomonadota bacterium]|nr:hypothetical protein [Pseudomonadota bacterium]
MIDRIKSIATALMLGPLLACGAALGANLESYFGTYVGVATVEGDETRKPEQRDIDIVITPYKKKGFQIQWTTVSRVDGRRDVPGVKRRVNKVLFVPGENKCCYVQIGEYNPFREREALRPMLGEPVRWALLDKNGLQIYSFAVLEDGRYELQAYNRRPTAEGIDLLYERIEDGVVKRRITGHTVRTADTPR